MMQARISACVVTFNDERSIAACLDSLNLCDEIVVVDAHSTDRTREIARAHGARVIERDSTGFRTQRRFAVNAASHDWILALAADERLSPELAAAIVRARIRGIGECSAYEMPIIVSCFGEVMRHGDWSPDHEVRLFDRRRVAIGRGEAGERVIAHGPVGRLTGNIRHDSYPDLAQYLSKLGRHANSGADAVADERQHGGALRMFMHPAWQFLRAYLWRGGFRDGWRGFAIAQIEANQLWQKYLRLYVAERTGGGESRSRRTA